MARTVTNVLNRLQSQGIIKLGTKNITINDQAGLEKTSET
ncbi:helix-turn-helix domain-containing protein [Chloroflexota bacterium]